MKERKRERRAKRKMTNPHHCEECGSDGSLYLHSRCHTTVPTWAVLSGDILTIECALCKKVIVRFRVVAEEKDEEAAHV